MQHSYAETREIRALRLVLDYNLTTRRVSGVPGRYKSGVAGQSDEVHFDAAVEELFPYLDSLGQLMPEKEYCTLLQCADGTMEPVTLELVNTASTDCLLIRRLVAEESWIRRRQALLGRLAGPGWHHIANVSTAGVGYLAYLKLQAGSPGADESAMDNVLNGIEKAFRRVQESARLMCSLARSYDSARELPLFTLCKTVASYIEGAFLPDYKITVISDEVNSGVLVNEITLGHMLVELLVTAYDESCRKVQIHELSDRVLELKTDRPVSFETKFGFNVSRYVGLSHGIFLKQVSNESLRLEILTD